MTAETIDHTTLADLADSGALSSARVIGQAGGWSIRVTHGKSEQTLAEQRNGKVRVFRKLDTLVAYLKEIGIVRFTVDAMNFGPADTSISTRPEHIPAIESGADVAYLAWLKAEVQEAIDDTSPSIPHDEAMRLIRAAVKLS